MIYFTSFLWHFKTFIRLTQIYFTHLAQTILIKSNACIPLNMSSVSWFFEWNLYKLYGVRYTTHQFSLVSSNQFKAVSISWISGRRKKNGWICFCCHWHGRNNISYIGNAGAASIFILLQSKLYFLFCIH